jgi:hypothetical protein
MANRLSRQAMLWIAPPEKMNPLTYILDQEGWKKRWGPPRGPFHIPAQRVKRF